MTAIVVPASEPQIAELLGDPGAAEALAAGLYKAATPFETFSERASDERLISGWKGYAYEAYRDAAGSAGPEHDAMHQSVRRVARAVTFYADTLQTLKRDRDDLRDRKQRLDADRTDLLAVIEAAVDPSASSIADLQARARDLTSRYRDLITDHDSWCRRVTDNEDQLRQSLASAKGLEGALSSTGGATQDATDAMNQPGAPGNGSTPAEVKSWWDGLSAEERAAVTAAYPETIGSADGLPASARDDANRILLDDDLATLEDKEADGTLTADEKKQLTNARAARDGLHRAENYIDPTTGTKPGGTLWLYDPTAFDGDGRVAVAVGDMDTADDVAVFTPGIKSEMTDTDFYTDKMTNVYESARYNGDGSSVAAMFWLGYDAPTGPTDPATLTEGRAEDGGRRLSDALDGLRASRPDDPHLTAIGHSYGSTTTAYAAADDDFAADDVVLIGSPGAGPAENADQLSVGSGHVYVGRDSRDGVAMLGDEGWVGKGPIGLGTDPSSEGFGATRFEAEDIDRSNLPNFGDAHGSYLDDDTESLYNIGKIVDGHGEDVERAEQSYDPWYSGAVDPESDRDPTANEPGRSDTGPDAD
jgi:pimeloyl-ACP methyl ester carboxylesterase